MKKLLVTFSAAALALFGGMGVSYAQSHGGFHGGGGGFHGGGGFRGGHFHGGHVRSSFGVFIGAPAFWWGPAYYPYYYPYPYSYYDPSAVYIDNDPPVYVERDTGAGVQREGEYSYYCTDPAGYYPQVPNCNKAWLKVVPDGSATPRPR